MNVIIFILGFKSPGKALGKIENSSGIPWIFEFLKVYEPCTKEEIQYYLTKKKLNKKYLGQVPGAPLRYLNDMEGGKGGGGGNKDSYFIPQKIPTSEFVYPNKSLHF